MSINAFALVAMLAFAPMQDAAPPAQAAEAAPTVEAAPAEPAPLSPIPDVTDDEFVLGEADAPVTLVAYTSMVCIQCAAWHTDVLPRLIENQIASGQVRFVMRQLPTAPTQISAIAAGIIRCSVKDHQMNVAGVLFANLQLLREDRMTDLDWYLTGIAASGRTREEIETCLADPATLPAVQQASAAARAAGVATVPSFFVDGERVASGSTLNLAVSLQQALLGGPPAP